MRALPIMRGGSAATDPTAVTPGDADGLGFTGSNTIAPRRARAGLDTCDTLSSSKNSISPYPVPSRDERLSSANKKTTASQQSGASSL